MRPSKLTSEQTNAAAVTWNFFWVKHPSNTNLYITIFTGDSLVKFLGPVTTLSHSMALLAQSQVNNIAYFLHVLKNQNVSVKLLNKVLFSIRVRFFAACENRIENFPFYSNEKHFFLAEPVPMTICLLKFSEAFEKSYKRNGCRLDDKKYKYFSFE